MPAFDAAGRRTPTMSPRRWSYTVPAPPESFGDHLARARRDAGMTQEELAEDAAITQSMVSSYETGKTQNPDPAVVARLEKALNLQAGTLFDRAGYRLGKRLVQQAAPPPGALVVADPSPEIRELVEAVIDIDERDPALVEALEYVARFLRDGKVRESDARTIEILRQCFAFMGDEPNRNQGSRIASA